MARVEQTYAIVGAAMAVHGELGAGFLESVYQDDLEIELTQRQIPFRREATLQVFYRGRSLPSRYRADFLCYEQIVVELKVSRGTGDADMAQVLHYLKSTGLKRGLLLNFGRESLQFRRFVLNPG